MEKRGVPLLEGVPLIENLRYFSNHVQQWTRYIWHTIISHIKAANALFYFSMCITKVEPPKIY